MSVISLNSTSTGSTGYTARSAYLGCAAIAAIKEQAALESGPVAYEVFPEDGGKPVATLAGTGFGTLVQAYHMGTPFDVRAEFQWNGVSIEATHPKTLEQIRKAYDAYVKAYPDINVWGRPVGVEVPVCIPEAMFGLEQTGAIDLLTETPEGYWVNDFKLLGREEETIWEQYSLREQGHTYALGYALEHNVEIAGVRYIAGFKRKEVEFRELRFEGLTPYRMRWLKNYFETIKQKRAAQKPEPSSSNCLPWGRVCSKLIEGRCSLL